MSNIITKNFIKNSIFRLRYGIKIDEQNIKENYSKKKKDLKLKLKVLRHQI
jgi:hypothetical protein